MSEARELKLGDEAPDFTLPDEEGNLVHLRDLRGKRVVVYFYPMDEKYDGDPASLWISRRASPRFRSGMPSCWVSVPTAGIRIRHSRANTSSLSRCWSTPTTRWRLRRPGPGTKKKDNRAAATSLSMKKGASRMFS